MYNRLVSPMVCYHPSQCCLNWPLVRWPLSIYYYLQSLYLEHLKSLQKSRVCIENSVFLPASAISLNFSPVFVVSTLSLLVRSLHFGAALAIWKKHLWPELGQQSSKPQAPSSHMLYFVDPSSHGRRVCVCGWVGSHVLPPMQAQRKLKGSAAHLNPNSSYHV